MKKFTTKNGLANSIVQKIIQDHWGYYWFATQNGLSRFDGKNFKNFHKSDGLPSSDITSLLEDNAGKLWVATAEGLAVFDGIKFTPIHEPGLDRIVYCISKDNRGTMWFATYGSGLISYNGKSYMHYTTKNGLPTDSLFSIMQDSQNNFWVGTYHYGVCKINPSSLTGGKLECKSFSKKDGMSSNNIFCLLEDKAHTIWMGTTNGAVSVIKNGAIQQEIISPEMATDFVSQMIEDRLGNIWIATQEHGLIKKSISENYYYGKNEGLQSQFINSLYLDNSLNLWIGSDQGVCIFRNEAITNFIESDGLTTKEVQCVSQDIDNKVLCGTAIGLSIYNGKKYVEISEFKEISVSSIATDEQNDLWIGTANQGIFLIDKNQSYKKVRNIIDASGIELSSPINGIAKSKSGDMWVATYGQGLFKFDDKGSVHYSLKDGLLSDNLHTLFIDRHENVWIGTYQAGLFKFDGTSFTNYTNKVGLADNTVYGICENKKGELFFATAEGGLSIYDGQKFHTLTTKNGLSSNLIYSVKVDNQNLLWLGTNNGLNRLKLKADFTVDSLKIFTEQNGLEGSEFISSNSLFIDKSGIIWAGTTNGLSKYNPALDFPNNTPPPLVLQSIRLFNQTVDWKKYADSVDAKTGLPLNLDLSYKNNHLTFNFQAISIDDNLKYSYQLEGFDKDWSALTSATEAVYTNIPSGKEYTFKVRAVNGDGVWSTKNIEYRFYIEAPIWQRWWFISLAIIFSVAGIFFYINWRTSKLAAEKKHLEEKVEERTTELKHTNDLLSEAFTDIKDSINYAQRIQEAILPMESIIREVFPDSFILFKPRDVVSGDFYWFGTVEKNGEKHHIIAAADCTGHGVPGAFMSMIGNTILSEIIVAKEVVEPGQILSLLHHGIRKALKQNLTTSRDGMDICLCSINLTTLKVKYAGAYNPLWVLRNTKEIEVIKANKCAIGGFTEDKQIFESHELQLEKGEALYLFTDGYADQFGGELGKKLTAKKFKEGILSVANEPMTKQKFYLDNLVEIWKGKEFQVDDILVIGIKV
ncbi:MAG: SpoIIE family protein phosphatase [Bacteroidetes bacterium]|nr:SpoIIE family protein phosphatase [Bacteroidota bacterium]